jgi:hypothetical protein
LGVIDVLVRGVEKEIENVKEFLTTPKGVFQTVDEIIVDARMTGRQLVQSVRPGLLGQRMGQRGQRVEIISRARRLLRR